MVDEHTTDGWVKRTDGGATLQGDTPWNFVEHTPPDGEWHHVVQTWDGVTRRVYVDGRRVIPPMTRWERIRYEVGTAPLMAWWRVKDRWLRWRHRS